MGDQADSTDGENREKLNGWIEELRNNTIPNALVGLFYYTATAGTYGAYSFRAARVLATKTNTTPTLATGNTSLSLEIEIALRCMEKGDRVDTERSALLPLYNTPVDSLVGMRLVEAPIVSLRFSPGTPMRTVGWYNGVRIAKQSKRNPSAERMATLYAMRVVFRPTSTQLTSFKVNRQLNDGLWENVQTNWWRLLTAVLGLGTTLTIMDAANTRTTAAEQDARRRGTDRLLPESPVELLPGDVHLDRTLVCFLEAVALVTGSVLVAQGVDYLDAESLYTHARLPLYKNCV